MQRSGSAGDSYVLSGWAKGNSVPLSSYSTNEREFEIEAVLQHYDDTTTRATLQFNPDSDEWQYASAVAVAPKSFFSITVIIRYNFNANTVYFDGVQLFKEEFGSSYTYDEDNNVIAVRDLQSQITDYEYDTNSNLTKIIQNDKAKMTYTYDEHHNVKTATTEEGLAYAFEYDDYGNNIKVTIGSGDSKMSSSATYSDDHNRLVSTTDALGKVTTYGYNADTNVLDWVQYPEDTEDTRTEYTYDTMYRMATAACETDTGLNLSAAYTYTDDLLASITTPTTTYSFTYGDFGLRESVKIGNRTLADYSYTDRNNYLSALDYGNSDGVDYTYDDKGRLTKETYEDGDTVTYTYNNSGNLASVTDSASNVTTTYYYDLTDRLVKYEKSGGDYGDTVTYTFDTQGNMTVLEQSITGIYRYMTYAYDDDNRPTGSGDGRSQMTVSYDGFGRMSGKSTRHSGTEIITDTYTYKSPTDTTTSAQVASHSIGASGFNKNYAYTYDDNGNILSISDGTNTTSYVYDSANQLIRENNQAGNYIHTWTYDNAGNIQNRKEYAYTPGELGTPTDTVTYVYGDSEWGDLLTSYDGQIISSDQIGNITDDGTWTYTWEHGRELASMSDGTTTWNYTYDADGLRTKRTDGTNTYTYSYIGGKVWQFTVNGQALYITYDATGMPWALYINGTIYYYITNLQGDVIAILDDTGAPVTTYTYDAWGKLLSITGSLADTIGKWNPLRYRGYVYDQETGLYYLQSRYYDPEMGRFINADGQLSGVGGDFLGYNQFAYCFNNPVNMDDSSGNWPKWLSGAMNVVSGALQTVAGAALGVTASWTGVGAVVAGLLMVNGVATITQGIGQTVNDITNSNVLNEDNMIKTGIQEIGQKIGGDLGEAIAGGAYDGAVIGSSIYAGTVIANQALNQYMPKIIDSKLFSINNGWGIKIGKYIEILYRNPNAAGGVGGTFFSYNGPLGKFRIDWDPAHGIHTHPPGHN